MKSIRVLIVDDDPNSLRLSRQAMEQLVDPAGIQCAQTAAETMQVLSQQPIDLVFLDIDMPDTSGFAIADYLRQHYPRIQYVFLTGYVDFAVRSYDYEPMDFLIKPIDLMRLQKTLERYESREWQQPQDYSRERIAVDTSLGFVLLFPTEISYIAKEHRLVKLHCLDGREYAVRHSMDELEGIFSDFGFFRIHQSYLVPLGNIVSVCPTRFGKTYEAVLNDQTHLPVSRDKYQKLRAHLINRGVQFI